MPEGWTLGGIVVFLPLLRISKTILPFTFILSVSIPGAHLKKRVQPLLPTFSTLEGGTNFSMISTISGSTQSRSTATIPEASPRHTATLDLSKLFDQFSIS